MHVERKRIRQGKNGAQQREAHTMKACDAKNEGDGQGACRRECRDVTQKRFKERIDVDVVDIDKISGDWKFGDNGRLG